MKFKKSEFILLKNTSYRNAEDLYVRKSDISAIYRHLREKDDWVFVIKGFTDPITIKSNEDIDEIVEDLITS